LHLHAGRRLLGDTVDELLVKLALVAAQVLQTVAEETRLYGRADILAEPSQTYPPSVGRTFAA
jgi:hypothetical protein